jgi:hypothetical protein
LSATTPVMIAARFAKGRQQPTMPHTSEAIAMPLVMPPGCGGAEKLPGALGLHTFGGG